MAVKASRSNSFYGLAMQSVSAAVCLIGPREVGPCTGSRAVVVGLEGPRAVLPVTGSRWLVCGPGGPSRRKLFEEARDGTPVLGLKGSRGTPLGFRDGSSHWSPAQNSSSGGLTRFLLPRSARPLGRLGGAAQRGKGRLSRSAAGAQGQSPPRVRGGGDGPVTGPLPPPLFGRRGAPSRRCRGPRLCARARVRVAAPAVGLGSRGAP